LASGLFAVALCCVAPTAAGASTGSGGTSLPVVTKDSVAPVFPKGTTVAQADAWLQRAINVRLLELTTLSADVFTAAGLPSVDRAGMQATFTAATAGLNALAKRGQNEVKLAAITADAAAMVLRYHVYKVLAPATSAALSTVASFAAITALSAKQAGVAAAIAASHQGPVVTATENRLDANLNSEIGSATTLLNSVVSALVGLNPGNLIASQAVLAAFPSTYAKVQQDISSGQSDVSRIVAKLAR
jgi:hypothetical protein